MSATIIAPFTFGQREYTVLEDLVNAMGLNWTEGRRLLFDGDLGKHVRKLVPAFANTCAAAEKEFQTKPNEGDRIFLKWLCRYPGIRGLYWRGDYYGGIDSLHARLAAQDETLQKLLLHMLKAQFLSTFIKNIQGPQALSDNVRFLERAYNRTNTRFSKRNALPILERLLSGDRTFAFAGQQFRTPLELAAWLQTFADTSKSALSRAVQPLFQDDCNFDPRFEAWIIMHGFHHELTLWKGRFQDGQGGADDVVEEFFFDEEQDQAVEARQLPEPEFQKSLDGFEEKFMELLERYADRIDDPIAFNALMSDYFPTYKLQCYLLMALYRMDIARAIRETAELTELLTVRFVKRLINDFGVKEPFARWAVDAWCRCYGEQLLKKKNPLHLTA